MASTAQSPVVSSTPLSDTPVNPTYEAIEKALEGLRGRKQIGTMELSMCGILLSQFRRQEWMRKV